MDNLMLPDELRRCIMTLEEWRAAINILNTRTTSEAVVKSPSARLPKNMDTQALAMKAEIDRVKKERTKVRIANMLAKKNGVTKDMPLEGKAALAILKSKHSIPRVHLKER